MSSTHLYFFKSIQRDQRHSPVLPQILSVILSILLLYHIQAILSRYFRGVRFLQRLVITKSIRTICVIKRPDCVKCVIHVVEPM